MGDFKNGLVWVATVTGLVLVVFCSRIRFVKAEDFEWEDQLVSWEESEGISPHVVSRRDVHKEVQECKGLKKGKPRIKECKKKGKLPVKDECRIFLRCAKAGEKPTPTCCPNGLHFDHRLRTCIGRKDAHCLNMCSENGTKYPDPNNFKQFLQCSNLGVPEEVPCPEGEHYVPNDSKCAVLGKEEVAKLAAQEIGLDEKAVDDIVMGYEFPPQILSDTNGTSEGNGTGGGNSSHSGGTLAVNVTVDYETDAKGNVVGVSEAPGDDDDDDASTTTPSSGIVVSTTDDSDEDDNTVASLPLCSTISPEALSSTTEATTTASDGSTTPNPGGNATVVNCINDENEEILPTNQTSGSKKIPQGRVFKMNFQADISFGAAKQEKKAAKGKITTAKPAGAIATTTKAPKAAAVKAKSASGCRSPTKIEEKEVETCKREGSIPLKNECRLFQKCYGPGKQPMFICCQAGMKFHHVLRRCVSEKEARCGPKVCSRKGIKYPHPDGGKYYLMCTKKGIPEEFECKDGAMYDDSEKKCMDSGLSNDMVNEMIANAAKKNGTNTKKSSGNRTVEGEASGGGNGTGNGNSTTLEDDDADMALLVQETLEGYHALNSTDDDDDGEMPVEYDAGVEGSVGGEGGGNGSTVASVDGGSSTVAPDGNTTVGGEGETTTGTTDTPTAAARKRKREVFRNYI